MPCDEWCRLVERYRSAVNTYNDAVKALGVAPGAAFNDTWQRTERTRTKCDRCRADLLHHEHDHSCLEVGEPNGNQGTSGIDTETLVLGDQGQSGG
jgi:hypothetical protein